MWHFVVCDDEELFRYEIVSRLRKALEGLGVDRKDYEILEYASLAQLHTCPVSPDWLLLDVLFQGESDGTQVAIHLRRKWPNMQLLFISSAAAFVWNSFEAYAVGYLLKKDLDSKFEATITRLMARLQKEKPAPPLIPFKIKREMYHVPLPDILYIEMQDRRLHLHLVTTARLSHPLSYKGTIRAEGNRLAGFGLYRLHKSLIVNLANVRQLARGQMILCNGESLWFNKDTFPAVYLQWAKAKESEEWNTFSH